MKPQKTFRISLAALMISFFMIAPVNSNEAVNKSKKISFSTHLQVVDEGSSKQANHLDLTFPESNKKERNKGHGEDQPKSKHHGDEEKHKNHLYHYSRVKAKKKHHTAIVCVALKIFVALSYISVLLCGYMSIGH